MFEFYFTVELTSERIGAVLLHTIYISPKSLIYEEGNTIKQERYIYYYADISLEILFYRRIHLLMYAEDIFGAARFRECSNLPVFVIKARRRLRLIRFIAPAAYYFLMVTPLACTRHIARLAPIYRASWFFPTCTAHF